jgi:anti-anti-sigma factor
MEELSSDRGAHAQISAGCDAQGAPLVTVSGDLDISNAEALQTSVEKLTSDQTEQLVFDLQAVRFIDSAALAVLIRAAQQVASVRLRHPSPAVRRVIELTGLTEILVIEP